MTSGFLSVDEDIKKLMTGYYAIVHTEAFNPLGVSL